MADKIIAPAIVQNLNMASDLYGDRSNIRNPYDLGVQIFEVVNDGGAKRFFQPLRTLNTHLLKGQSQNRPGVGTNFEATFNWSSFLPNGFASDQFYYAVTSIGLSAVAFGAVTAPLQVPASDTVMTKSPLVYDPASLGSVVGLDENVSAPGQVLNSIFRATFANAWMEYKQDGRKTSFVFDQMLNIPSVTSMNDAAGVGLSLQSNRAMLPVPFLLSPRNTNQSQEVVLVHFEIDTAVPVNPSTNKSQIIDVTAASNTGDNYALVYKLDFGGYFCDAQGNPAEQDFTLTNARLAADYRPVGG